MEWNQNGKEIKKKRHQNPLSITNIENMDKLQLKNLFWKLIYSVFFLSYSATFKQIKIFRNKRILTTIKTWMNEFCFNICVPVLDLISFVQL